MAAQLEQQPTSAACGLSRPMPPRHTQGRHAAASRSRDGLLNACRVGSVPRSVVSGVVAGPGGEDPAGAGLQDAERLLDEGR